MPEFVTGKTPDFIDDPLFPNVEPSDADQILPKVLEKLKEQSGDGDYLLMFSLKGADLDIRLLDWNRFMTGFARIIRDQ